MENKFEEFLQERHAEEYKGFDDMPDDFEKWLGKLDIDQWLNYGEWFANLQLKKELEKRLKEK